MKVEEQEIEKIIKRFNQLRDIINILLKKNGKK